MNTIINFVQTQMSLMLMPDNNSNVITGNKNCPYALFGDTGRKKKADRYSYMVKNKGVLNRIKILFLAMFLFSSLYGQEFKGIYGVFQPLDIGVGVRADLQIGDNEYYTSISYGNGGVYREYWLKDHYKVSAGYMFLLSDRGSEYDCWLTGGLNFHIVNNMYEYEHPTLNKIIYSPISFELGTTARINKFLFGVRTDIIRWEPCVDFSYNFSRFRMFEYY